MFACRAAGHGQVLSQPPANHPMTRALAKCSAAAQKAPRMEVGSRANTERSGKTSGK